MTRRTVPILCTVFLAACPMAAQPAHAGPPSLGAPPVIFSDGTFNNADWSSTMIVDTSPGQPSSFTAGQRSAGGNPGMYRYVGHDWAGIIQVAHLRPAAVRAAATDGPIGSIDCSFDLVITSAFSPFAEVAYYLLLKQDDTYYAGGWSNIGVGGWLRFTHRGLTASSFAKVVGPGPVSPDFSAAGAPITFGYGTANSAGDLGDPTHYFMESGVDNWAVTIHAVVAPPGDIRWISASGGLFSVPANWNGGAVPGEANTAVFDLGAVYTVGFTREERTAALTHGLGSVNFDLDGHRYTVGDIDQAPGAALSVINGELVADDGEEPYWSFAGAIAVAGPTAGLDNAGSSIGVDGQLLIAGGASASAFRWDIVGEVLVTGDGSFFTAYNAYGDGTLTLTDGAGARSTEGEIGLGAVNVTDFARLRFPDAAIDHLRVERDAEVEIEFGLRDCEAVVVNGGVLTAGFTLGCTIDVGSMGLVSIERAVDGTIGVEGGDVMIEALEGGSLTVSNGFASVEEVFGVVEASGALVRIGPISGGGAVTASKGAVIENADPEGVQVGWWLGPGSLTVGAGCTISSDLTAVGHEDEGPAASSSLHLDGEAEAVTVNRAGVLTGAGLTHETVANHGLVSPGGPEGGVGVLRPAAFRMHESGTLRIDIAGRGEGMHDQVFARLYETVLAGTLDVRFAGGFVPARGDAFEVVSGQEDDPIEGVFETLTVAGAPPNLRFEIVYTDTAAILTALASADINNDGVVNSDDFFSFLNLFFANNAAADFNADGLINSNDVFDFLAAFFGG